jgi:hypothetical protein
VLIEEIPEDALLSNPAREALSQRTITGSTLQGPDQVPTDSARVHPRRSVRPSHPAMPGGQDVWIHTQKTLSLFVIH